MEFNLDKDICFFDLEATGLNVLKDRIIQIAIIKYFADGREEQELSMLINPGPVLISAEAYKVHGISAKDVSNKPTFTQVAQKIFDFIGDADLAGYNSNRFDIPLLMEEFDRAGFDFSVDERRLIDVQRIFYKMEPRTLSAAVRYYCGKEMENAHDALADVKATVDVFKGQISKYESTDYKDDNGVVTKQPIRNDIQAVYDFTIDPNAIDVTNRLKYNEEGVIVFNFGKHIGQSVEEVITRVEPNYYNWILNKDFSVQVKNCLRKIMKDYNDRKEN